MAAPAPIYFGIAGWSYPDWEGIVYPRGTREHLGYIAHYVDLIEINSSFYRVPLARHAAGWLKQTAFKPEFRFSAKVPQDITHGGLLSAELVHQLQDGFAPLIEAGKLTHFLAQFKYDFNDTAEHRDYLSRTEDTLGGLTNLTLELRHNSWQVPSALAFLESLAVTVANLDYPMSHTSFNLARCHVGAERYLRLHGRNSAAWFDKAAGRDETYNYYYSRAELQGLRQRAEALREGSKSLTVVTNNHFKGQEVANILQLKALFSGDKVPVPLLLREHYPELNEIAAPQKA
ncbi:MAG: DUF72 domain-containing protein [Lentisphaerae bacterium]|nr:DUF72 domain-containing protein [Lentisphaerota bacterium]